MTDLKQQIFHELSTLDDMVGRLRATAVNAGKQTDLEVAILNQQVKSMRDKNARATEIIDKSMAVLTSMSKKLN